MLLMLDNYDSFTYNLVQYLQSLAAEVIARAYGARLAGVYSVFDVAPLFEYGIQEGAWPSMYECRAADGYVGSLDRIEVTGTRLRRAPAPESMQAGYVTFNDKIYTVFSACGLKS